MLDIYFGHKVRCKSINQSVYERSQYFVRLLIFTVLGLTLIPLDTLTLHQVLCLLLCGVRPALEREGCAGVSLHLCLPPPCSLLQFTESKFFT